MTFRETCSGGALAMRAAACVPVIACAFASGGVAAAEEPDAPVQLSLSYTADVIGAVRGGVSQRG